MENMASPLGWQIFGVKADNAVLTAHLHTWKIDFASNSKEFSVINRSAKTQKTVTEVPRTSIPSGVGDWHD